MKSLWKNQPRSTRSSSSSIRSIVPSFSPSVVYAVIPTRISGWVFTNSSLVNMAILLMFSHQLAFLIDAFFCSTNKESIVLTSSMYGTPSFPKGWNAVRLKGPAVFPNGRIAADT